MTETRSPEVRILNDQESHLETLLDSCVTWLLRADQHILENDCIAWEQACRNYQDVMHQAELQLRLVTQTRRDEYRDEDQHV